MPDINSNYFFQQTKEYKAFCSRKYKFLNFYLKSMAL